MTALETVDYCVRQGGYGQEVDVDLSKREWAAAGAGGGCDCQSPIRIAARDEVDRLELPASSGWR